MMRRLMRRYAILMRASAEPSPLIRAIFIMMSCERAYYALLMICRCRQRYFDILLMLPRLLRHADAFTIFLRCHAFSPC